MVDNKEALIVEEVLSVPITIGQITTEVSCLVVRTIPYDLIIGRPSLKTMGASLVFDKDIATFRHHTGITCISLQTEGRQPCSTLSDEFTSEEEVEETEEDPNDTEEEESGEDSAQELVLTLAEQDSQPLE